MALSGLWLYLLTSNRRIVPAATAFIIMKARFGKKKA
jgi:hypothetical protein